MTDVLVVYATTMGSTRQIAEAITATLRAGGLTVDLRDAATHPDPHGYRAVIVGSALYLRRWRPDAMRFLRHHTATLRRLPLWLFQSGPTDPDTDTSTPWPVRRLQATLGAHQPVMTFGGRLDTEHANGPVARWMARSAELCGDARDWDAIREWANHIRNTLATSPSTPATAASLPGSPR